MLLSALLFLSQPALAVDSKTLPGSACQPTTSTYAANLVISKGAIYNSSTTSSIKVVCPIIDDTSGDLDYTYLYVYDGHSTSAIECNLYSRDISSAATGDSDSDSSTGTGSQTLTFLDVGGTAGDYYQYLECTIPAKGTSYSYIYGYYAHEED